jgi:hypothetical protein
MILKPRRAVILKDVAKPKLPDIWLSRDGSLLRAVLLGGVHESVL